MTQPSRPDLSSRRSVRLRGYDYSSNGAYVVTICTHQRQPMFGNVRDGTMHLSPAGKIVEQEWHHTEEMRPGVFLDAVVVMPNHCHGIVILNLPDGPGRDLRRSAGLKAPSQGLATIVGGFKGAVARRIREECQDVVMPIWQRGYYDRIIRDEDELQRFRVYIVLNPEKWELDRYFQRYEGEVSI